MEWICVNWWKYLTKDNFFLADERRDTPLANFGQIWLSLAQHGGIGFHWASMAHVLQDGTS
jgi:hypothetical protein